MSFPTFKFKELVKEDWENSTLRNMLDAAKFFFVIFEEQKEVGYVFKGAKFWHMPEKDLDSVVKEAWLQTVQTLKKGVRLTYKGGSVKNNFISGSEKRIIHIRPHAAKASYQEKIQMQMNCLFLPDGLINLKNFLIVG